MNKNLLSVHKLCQDNNVKIEFDYKTVLIKDCITGRLVCEGSKDKGLYKLFVDSLSKVNISEATSKNLLYHLLGHLNT